MKLQLKFGNALPIIWNEMFTTKEHNMLKKIEHNFCSHTNKLYQHGDIGCLAVHNKYYEKIRNIFIGKIEELGPYFGMNTYRLHIERYTKDGRVILNKKTGYPEYFIENNQKKII